MDHKRRRLQPWLAWLFISAILCWTNFTVLMKLADAREANWEWAEQWKSLKEDQRYYRALAEHRYDDVVAILNKPAKRSRADKERRLDRLAALWSSVGLETTADATTSTIVGCNDDEKIIGLTLAVRRAVSVGCTFDSRKALNGLSAMFADEEYVRIARVTLGLYEAMQTTETKSRGLELVRDTELEPRGLAVLPGECRALYHFARDEYDPVIRESEDILKGQGVPFSPIHQIVAEMWAVSLFATGRADEAKALVDSWLKDGAFTGLYQKETIPALLSKMEFLRKE